MAQERLTKAEVKLNGFMLTPRLNITKTKKGYYKTHFVIGIPQKQVLRHYPTLVKKMKCYSCVWYSKDKAIPKFVETVKRMDFIKITGTLEPADFYVPENAYEHIDGARICVNSAQIATEEYKRYQEQKSKERKEKSEEREVRLYQEFLAKQAQENSDG